VRARCILLGSLLAGCAGSDPGTPRPLPDAAAGVDAASGVDAAQQDAASPPEAGPSADGGDTDAQTDAGSSPGLFEVRRVSSAPRYQGSVNNSGACSQSYPTQGYEPVSDSNGTSPQRHPLFLYFVGTAFVSPDASASYDGMAATKVVEALARRGFVALSADYDHGPLAWLSDHTGQLACLFGAGNKQSLIAQACALPQVDCNLGIAVWGHSMGGYVAAMAYNQEPRVRAVWATGYGGDGAAKLPKSRLRVVNGEADTSNGTAATLNTITGLRPADCPDADQCLRADGSGWIIVRKSQLAAPANSSADHCWFDRQHCSDSAITLEPNWIHPDSREPFALESNADWMIATLRRP
jgi:hypothetical protein